MHWLNTSAHAAGTEEIIRHIKQRCEGGGAGAGGGGFIVLQLCKSFYAPEITSPHSVGEFLKKAEGLRTTAWGKGNRQGMSMSWCVDDFSC